MPGEGRGLSSRQTQDVVRDLEIGQPSNSEKCSETADGVTRESEGGSQLSLLRPVRQDQPRRYSGARLCPVPLQQGRTGRGRPGLCGHRSVWGRAVAGRTGACAQGGDIPTGADQTRVHTEGQRQTQAAGHLDRAGSGLHDGSDAGAGADLRSRPSTGNLRLPRWTQRPAGRRRGGGAAVSRPSGSRGRRPRGLLGSCFILPPSLWSDVKQHGVSGYWLDPHPFFLSSQDMNGVELAALDTLQYGLAGDPEKAHCLVHREVTLRRFIDKAGAQILRQASAQGSSRGDLLTADEAVIEPAVDGRGGGSKDRGRLFDSQQLALGEGSGRLEARNVPLPPQTADMVGGKAVTVSGMTILTVEDTGDDGVWVISGQTANEDDCVLVGAHDCRFLA